MRLTSKEATVRSSVLLAITACATAAAPSPQACPPSTPPIQSLADHLSMDETTHDLGEILRGETVSHTFKLTNTSALNVTLFEVRACCTCATAAMTIGEKHMTAGETATCKLLGTLRPQEHAELTITLNTLDGGCSDKDGAISKSVRVFSSDRTSSPLTISITGCVATPYTLEPSGLHFGKVKQGQPANAECIIITTKLHDFKVVSARSSADFIKLTIDPIPTPQAVTASFRVSATLLPSAPAADLKGYAFLDLDHPRVRSILVPLSALVEARSESK